jgi:deoxyadenosine/deoxycytidine kinase
MLIKGYVGISGIIGVGKSTLTSKLAQALDFEPVQEDAFSNPYLPKFYQDMKSYAFRMQIWFLNHRVRQHRRLAAKIHAGKTPGIIKDRTVWEDKVFARMFNQGREPLLPDVDYRTYLEIFDCMMGDDPAIPELLIYLDCKPETAFKRMRRRGRSSEKNAVDLDYLKALSRAYEDFLQEMQASRVQVLRLDWEKFIPISEVARAVRRLIGAPGPRA